MSASLAAPVAAPVRRPAPVAVTLILTLLALLATVLVAPSASAEPASEGDLVNRLNGERVSRGLPALRVTADLTDIARAHANRMAAEGRLYHNPNLTTDVPGWLRVSENVGYGPDVAAIHTALMNSTGHRTNMLDGVVTQVGIGTAWAGTRLYVTQVFRKPDGSTVNAPGPVVAPPPPPPPAEPVDLGLAACPRGLPTSRFADVPAGTISAANVDCAAWWDLVRGVGDGRFAPNVNVNRAQVASLIARQLDLAGRLPVASRDWFGDDNGNVHEGAINALAEKGILAGSGPGRFEPNRGLSRDQLASVLVRVQEYILGQPLPVSGMPFNDLNGNVHYTAVAKAYAAGLTTGLTPTSYGPAGQVPRRHMAAFLVRAVDKLLAANIVQAPRG